MNDPKEIYLSPPCCSDMVGEGRLWCENDEWPEGDCGTPEEHRPATRYVRADLAHAELMKVREEMANHSPITVARFWSKVSVTQRPESCWEWQGARHGKGYGHIRISGKVEKAHRIAYEIAVGPIPDGMHVCHACDNPPCCNPKHLWLGTNEDNLLDRQSKRRHAHGVRHSRARLTEDEVREIVAIDGISHSRIAEMFGVSKTTVSHIKRGRSWRHIPRLRRAS